MSLAERKDKKRKSEWGSYNSKYEQYCNEQKQLLLAKQGRGKPGPRKAAPGLPS